MAPTPTRLAVDGARPAADAFARARAVWQGVSEGRPAALYLAPLTGAAAALGAHQLERQALSPAAAREAAVVRRPTGGVTVFAGDGVSYLALCLRDASSLMKCPPGRILNRNVRGTLASLRALGVPAHYFGRDFVSVNGRPGAHLGWDEAEDGRVLVELFVSVTASHVPPGHWSGYAARAEDPFRGKLPTTLHDAGRDAAAAAIADAVARGHALAYGLALEDEPVSEAEAALAARLGACPGPPAELAWSAPREEAIGFVSAGVELAANGAFARVALGGDVLLRRREAAQVSRELAGREPEAQVVGEVLDRLFARPTGALEGVRSLKTLRDAVLDAAALAAAAARGADAGAATLPEAAPRRAANPGEVDEA